MVVPLWHHNGHFSPQHLSKKKNVNLSILSLTDHYLETPVTSPSCEIQELQRWPVSFWETHGRKCNRIASTLSLTIQLSLSFPLSVLNSWSIHSVFPSCAVAAAPWQTVACLSADWQTDGQTVRVSDITSLPWKNKRKPAALWLVKLDVNVDSPPPPHCQWNLSEERAELQNKRWNPLSPSTKLKRQDWMLPIFFL